MMTSMNSADVIWAFIYLFKSSSSSASAAAGDEGCHCRDDDNCVHLLILPTCPGISAVPPAANAAVPSKPLPLGPLESHGVSLASPPGRAGCQGGAGLSSQPLSAHHLSK